MILYIIVVMTKVSRLPLRKDVWERIFKLFIETLAGIKEQDKLRKFIDDFFSPTEKIMFAKRLAASVLLAKGHSYQKIREILRISPQTIARINLKVRYGGKGLNPIISDISKKQKAQIVWKQIEELFDIPAKGTLKSPERFKRQFVSQKEIERLAEEF